MKRCSAVLVFLAVTPVFSRASAQQELDFLSGLKEFHDLRQMLPKHLKARANKMLSERHEKVASWGGADDEVHWSLGSPALGDKIVGNALLRYQ